jgi:hypothetical protein
VVIIDSTWESLALSVISQLTNVIVKLSTIVKICKYRMFHEGHHFISMAMDVHDTPEHDMDHFIKECARLFHDRQSGGHLSLSFCIQFFKHHVSITFQCILTFVIKKKITLASDVCSRTPIIIKFRNLHVGDIRGAMDEIALYQERD